MAEHDPSADSGRVYRIDKFVVPAASRGEFLDRVAKTHDLLRRQQGFVDAMVAEQISGPGAFNVVTVVQWERAEVIDRVAAEVAKWHAETGFDREALVVRLGIRADIATYRRLPM
jgi:hypothetical protein